MMLFWEIVKNFNYAFEKRQLQYERKNERFTIMLGK